MPAKPQAEPHNASRLQRLLHDAGATHLRARKRGAAIIVESCPRHDPVKHFRVRRDTVHLVSRHGQSPGSLGTHTVSRQSPQLGPPCHRAVPLDSRSHCIEPGTDFRHAVLERGFRTASGSRAGENAPSGEVGAFFRSSWRQTHRRSSYRLFADAMGTTKTAQ